ncbi:MAG: hypothetical protein KDI65_06110 [Alphaproteobacteria bacterium]|nr:hypothetical protein [Alphaproteobacteria bacterium]
MMWALLDIRVGRANRVQFYSVALLCCLGFYGLSTLENLYAGGAAAIVPAYLVLLMWVRRYRDTQSTVPKKNPVLAALEALALLVGSFFLLLLYILITIITGGKASSNSERKFFDPFKAVVEDILSPVISIFFKSSAPYLTEYGLPPTGYNFLTMTYQTYPPTLRQKVSETVRKYEATEEKVTEQEEQGLEALMERQARKAARRKRFLFTEEFDVDDV